MFENERLEKIIAVLQAALDFERFKSDYYEKKSTDLEKKAKEAIVS